MRWTVHDEEPAQTKSPQELSVRVQSFWCLTQATVGLGFLPALLALSIRMGVKYQRALGLSSVHRQAEGKTNLLFVNIFLGEGKDGLFPSPQKTFLQFSGIRMPIPGQIIWLLGEFLLSCVNILRGILGNTKGSEAGRRQEDTVNGYLVDFLGGQMLKIKTLTVDSHSFV